MAEQVTALLDRPVASSMGMLGVVVAKDDGTLHTAGVLESQGGPVTAAELEDLLRGGHGLRIEPIVVDPADPGVAALWVGDEFAEKALSVGLRVPPIPRQASGRAPSGAYWVVPVRHVWRILDSWLTQAFRRAVVTRDANVASLMSWVMPDRDESRAARWLTASRADRGRDLEWWTRLDRDRGLREVDPDRLVASFLRLTAAVETSPLQRVVGFSAPAKGGDKDIARFVARAARVPWISFGQWLRTKAEKEGEKPGRRVLQKLGKQVIDQRGELYLCLEVLEQLSAGLSQQAFLIEGIRHLDVYYSVQSLVGADRFDLAFVDRPVKERRELLREEGLSAAEVRSVLEDPTEAEIPRLRALAKWQLDGSRGPEVEGSKILRHLGASR